MSSSTSKTPAIIPRRTMQGHTDRVTGVVQLNSGRQTITCSWDGALRLWDLESGAQIGKDWRDEDASAMWSMALSPNGNTVASGSGGMDNKVRLWNVKTRKVIARWAGHTNLVYALCWSGDGNRVLSGSWDGTARVWDVKSGKNVLTIKTGDDWVRAVAYSPDTTKIATGADKENALKIWNAKTGELFITLKHDNPVESLAWTSDGETLVSGSFPIRIFDTATWQEIAVLEGHTHLVIAISLSHNERLLASASLDKTVLLWNLDTNLQVGPPLQHEHFVRCAALSADGKVLVTGCQNGNTYTWDIHAILEKASLEDQVPIGTNIASHSDSAVKRTPRSSISDKSFLEADATRCHNESGDVDELPPRFFDSMEADVDSSPMSGAHPRSSASALLARLSLLFRRFRPEATELPQPSTPSALHPRVLFARLSLLVHRSPSENDASNELQQPSTPSRLDPHVLLARLSSLFPRSRLNTDEETSPHPTMPSGLRLDALVDHLSSFFRSQTHTNDEIELSQRSRHPRVVEVAAVRDREVIFTAPPPPQKTQQQSQSHAQGSSTTPLAPGTNPNTPRPRYPHSLPVRLLAHLVLFLCCASPQHPDASAQQQQGQSPGQVHAQASSSQTQPAAPSTSTTLTAPDTHTTAPGPASP